MIPDRLLLATGNQKKLKELREILTPVRISVVSPADIGYDTKRHILLIPSFQGNTVILHPLAP